MKEFFTKNKQPLITVIALILYAILGVDFSGNDVVVDDVVTVMLNETFKPMVREVVQEENKKLEQNVNEKFESIDNQLDDLYMQTYMSDIDMLASALSEVRTVAQVDELVKYWKDNHWDVQLNAIQRISEYHKARDKLSGKLYSEEVFKALMTYSK